MKKRIAVFTGTRAEYGLLRPLLIRFTRSNVVELKLLVSGAHLSTEHGLTYREIEKDGFFIDEKLEILVAADTRTATCASMGLALAGFGGCLSRLSPDVLVIIGDRFEAFCAAAAATVMGIPIAHLHGGEITEGAFDNGFRHAITKLSHFHFASTVKHADRIIQLGESPEHVYVAGALGIDNIKMFTLLTREELEKQISPIFNRPYLLVTYHPTTITAGSEMSDFTELLNALSSFQNIRIAFTMANADPGGRKINSEIIRFVESHPEKAAYFRTMGQIPYLSALKFCSAVVGNSSSGIIEAPSLCVPTVDVGDRQKGRVRASSVLHCEAQRDSIISRINAAISSYFSPEDFSNPYGDGEAAQKIVSVLESVSLYGIMEKHFYDLPVN